VSREPNNRGSEEIDNFSKTFFFAVEHTAKTSPMDIDDFNSLLQLICKKYNLKSCQCVWREKDMKRLKNEKNEHRNI